ncbi:MAG: hypothetical protein C4321_00760 [Chloroflexota bacterium]
MNWSNFDALRWVIKHRLLKVRRGGNIGGNEQIVICHDEVVRFLEDERTWHLWEVEQITDPAYAQIARNRRGTLRWLSAKEAARIIGVAPQTIARWAREDGLPHRRGFNDTIWIHPETVRTWRPETDIERQQRGMRLLVTIQRRGLTISDIARIFGMHANYLSFMRHKTEGMSRLTLRRLVALEELTRDWPEMETIPQNRKKPHPQVPALHMMMIKRGLIVQNRSSKKKQTPASARQQSDR